MFVSLFIGPNRGGVVVCRDWFCCPYGCSASCSCSCSSNRCSATNQEGQALEQQSNSLLPCCERLSVMLQEALGNAARACSCNTGCPARSRHNDANYLQSQALIIRHTRCYRRVETHMARDTRHGSKFCLAYVFISYDVDSSQMAPDGSKVQGNNMFL